MGYTINNGSANITKIYAIDDVNNGIEYGYVSRDACIEAIIDMYSVHDMPYLKDYVDGAGKAHPVAEQVYEDIQHLKDHGYIDDSYYILEIEVR